MVTRVVMSEILILQMAAHIETMSSTQDLFWLQNLLILYVNLQCSIYIGVNRVVLYTPYESLHWDKVWNLSPIWLQNWLILYVNLQCGIWIEVTRVVLFEILILLLEAHSKRMSRLKIFLASELADFKCKFIWMNNITWCYERILTARCFFFFFLWKKREKHQRMYALLVLIGWGGKGGVCCVLCNIRSLTWILLFREMKYKDKLNIDSKVIECNKNTIKTWNPLQRIAFPRCIAQNVNNFFQDGPFWFCIKIK